MEIKEAKLKEQFKQLIQLRGFRILKEITNAPSDLIIEKDGRKVGIEFKASEDNPFPQALGQLLIGKIKFNFDKMWLVLDFIPSKNKTNELEAFKRHRISMFAVVDGKIIKVTKKNLRPLITQKQSDTCNRIFEIVNMFPEGVTFNEIAEFLNMKPDVVRFFVKGQMKRIGSCGGWLRKNIIIEGNLLKPIIRNKSLSDDMISSIKRTLSRRNVQIQETTD